MKQKSYNFNLPRTITRKQWGKIHRQVRMLMKTERTQHAAEKYGFNALGTIERYGVINYFWCPVSHIKYDRGFIKNALRGNSTGLTSSRVGGKVQSLNDPSNPLYDFRSVAE